jgi:hypothetical protein
VHPAFDFSEFRIPRYGCSDRRRHATDTREGDMDQPSRIRTQTYDVTVSPTDLPPRSISHSSRQDLGRCLRRYYISTWTAYGGWDPNSSPVPRMAYRLKRLTNLDFVLGGAVHNSARDRALAIVRGGPLKPLAEIRELRSALTSALQSSSNPEA